MYVYIKQLGIVCLLCWLGLSCTLQRTEHPALRQAGYLMEEHSDSAFSLLKSISSLTGMSPEDKKIKRTINQTEILKVNEYDS